MTGKPNKKRNLVYEHYLKTGRIYTQYEGFYHDMTSGGPPTQVMSEEDVMRLASKRPAGKPLPVPWGNRTSSNQRKLPLDDFQVVLKLRHPKARDITREACRNGSIAGVYDYVRDNHELPPRKTRNELKGSADFVTQCAAGNVNMGGMHKSLATLAELMIERRSELLEKFADL